MKFVHRYSNFATLIASCGDPIVGTVLRSTRGACEARQVVAFDEDSKRVTWRPWPRKKSAPFAGLTPTCTLKTWHAWVERNEAEVAVLGRRPR